MEEDAWKKYSSSEKEEELNEFDLLEPLELDYEQHFSTQPFEVDYQVLDNGLTCYVKKYANPKDVVHLSLLVKTGSVYEDDNEGGVAHVVEHLALEGHGYTDPDALDYLQVFKNQIAPHHNAHTTNDYTIYKFAVHDVGNLKKVIALMAAIAHQLVFNADELAKEKQVILQELWIDSKNEENQKMTTFSALLLKGTKYAEPVGGTKESVQHVSADTVKGFYKKWYVPDNMAVIVVGDISETQGITNLIKQYFGKQPRGMPKHLEFPLPKHSELRLSTLVDAAIVKWGLSEVHVTFMFEKEGSKCVNDVFLHCQRMLLINVFVGRLRKRFKSMRIPNEVKCRGRSSLMYTTTTAWVQCEGDRTIEALETFLVEIARMRVHRVEEHELSEGIDSYLQIYEHRYLNRHDNSSELLREDYVKHFIYNEAYISPKLDAQIIKALAGSIYMDQMTRLCEMLFSGSNLSVIIFQSKSFMAQEDMERTLQKVTDSENAGSIPSWSKEVEGGSTDLILELEIESGKIVERVEHADIGVVELILSNGMQVSYRCTEDDNKVFLQGISYGGLSEVAETDFLSCWLSRIIGEMIWIYSSEKLPLIREKVNFCIEVDEYRRCFGAIFDSSDIKLALQILYLLFTIDLEPGEADFQAVIDDMITRCSPGHQGPDNILVDTAREINSGKSCFYKKTTAEDFSNVDGAKAWKYFRNCFKDPSSFRVVLVGNFDSSSTESLLSHYLGGIPRPSVSIMEFQRGKLTTAPFDFPQSAINKEVSFTVDSSNGMYIYISFPLNLKNETLEEDLFLLGNLQLLLQVKVRQVLRHKERMVYSVGVDTFTTNGHWSSSGSKHGTISFKLHFGDSDAAQMVVDSVLHEIEQLQEEGPSEELVQDLLSRRRLDKEDEEEINLLMLLLLRAYGSSMYDGDLAHTYKILRKIKASVWDHLDVDFIKLALQRLLPYPCRGQYTVVKLSC